MAPALVETAGESADGVDRVDEARARRFARRVLAERPVRADRRPTVVRRHHIADPVRHGITSNCAVVGGVLRRHRIADPVRPERFRQRLRDGVVHEGPAVEVGGRSRGTIARRIQARQGEPGQ